MIGFFNDIFINKHGENKLANILRSKLFWVGLCIKVLFAITFASSFLTDLFMPFINYYVTSGFDNPYQHFLNISQGNSFPYPVLMLYIMSIPQVLFGLIFNFKSATFTTIFLTRLPVLLADFLVLVVFSRLIKGNYKRVIIYYWLSPILIYINYIHGQLDAIPMSILFISLYFLFKRKFFHSSIFLGLAISSKTSMLLVLPFYLIYLSLSQEMYLKKTLLNFSLIIFTFFFVNLPYLFNTSFLQMVFNNKEQLKIFDCSYNFPNSNTLYFVPLAYLFLFLLAINLKCFSKDVYMMFLGFCFGIITLLVSPMQGWYYWVIPFFIYFHCKRSNDNYDLATLLFISLQVTYFTYFLLIKNSDYTQVFQLISPLISHHANLYSLLQDISMDADKAVNISFTLLQTILLANCIFIYHSGVKSYAKYKIFSHPFLLGICGDSGAGKTTVANALSAVFNDSNTTVIHGDDMHKWERGDKNWQNITHLNPKSNLLHNEISQLKALKNNEAISRRSYDHSTGKFTDEKKFKANNLVIFEGLHSFYLKQMRDIYDLKIFINPSDDLRKYWKLCRDNNKRGHSADTIRKELDNREKDSLKFIKSQLKYGDIIVEIIAYKDSVVSPDTLKLKLTATNSFYIEPIFTELNSVNSLDCKHEYEDEDKQYILVTGNITAEDIDLISDNLLMSKTLEDLGIDEPSWVDDYLGIIQVFITYCIILNIMR